MPVCPACFWRAPAFSAGCDGVVNPLDLASHEDRGGTEDRTPTHGYEPTREAAMAAFAKSWRRGSKPTKEVEATSILPPRT